MRTIYKLFYKGNLPWVLYNDICEYIKKYNGVFWDPREFMSFLFFTVLLIHWLIISIILLGLNNIIVFFLGLFLLSFILPTIFSYLGHRKFIKIYDDFCKNVQHRKFSSLCGESTYFKYVIKESMINKCRLLLDVEKKDPEHYKDNPEWFKRRQEINDTFDFFCDMGIFVRKFGWGSFLREAENRL